MSNSFGISASKGRLERASTQPCAHALEYANCIVKCVQGQQSSPFAMQAVEGTHADAVIYKLPIPKVRAGCMKPLAVEDN